MSSVIDILPLKNSKKRKRRFDYRKRFNAVKKLMAQNTDQFCQNTTLHGLKYLTDKDLYPREKLFFGIAFVTVVVLAFYFAARVIEKWTTTPVIFGMNPKPTMITEVPFPAVTICNLNQAYKSKAEQYSTFSSEYAMLQMLCRREVNVTIADTITDWSHLQQFIIDISQTCTDMLISCSYGAVTYNCSELFQPVVTDEGLCCAFNMVHSSHMYSSSSYYENNVSDIGGFKPVAWTYERGYPKNLPPKYYPRPGVGKGETLGLSVTLDVESDQYYCSSANSVGFKILLHSPTEKPSLREVGLLLAAGRETKIRIAAEAIETERNLQSINRNSRYCLFEDEQKLNLFASYTQRNCDLDCMAEMLQKYCGCISHYMPHLGNETICSIYESTCVERIRVASMLKDFSNYTCSKNCLPGCYDLSFLPDFFSTPLTHFGFQISSQQIKNMSSNYAEKNIAVIHLYFKENYYRSKKQTEFFGVTDVLSNIGGLIGVFFGFSFISVAEFIFFSMIRPFRSARQVGLLNDDVIIVSSAVNQTKGLVRKRYRHEMGFNMNSLKTEGELDISKLYMKGEFLKKKINAEQWVRVTELEN